MIKLWNATTTIITRKKLTEARNSFEQLNYKYSKKFVKNVFEILSRLKSLKTYSWI